MTDTKVISIWGQDFEVKFPNVRQVFAIHNLKAVLSNNNYETYLTLGYNGQVAALMVDMISHFSILIPEFKNKLKTEDIIDLPINKVMELTFVYMDDFKPWFDDIMNTLSMRNEAQKEPVSA